MTEENPHAGQGAAVVLDIGGDVGALIVVMPAGMDDVEVEIRPAGSGPYFAAPGSEPGHDQQHVDHDHDDAEGHGHGHGHGEGHLPHVAVVERPMGRFMVPTLVYGEVLEGSYELAIKGSDEIVMAAEVLGGEVTETRWPGA